MSFSPIAHQPDDTVSEQQRKTHEISRDHNMTGKLVEGSNISGMAESEVIERAMTPVIGSFSQDQDR